MAESEEWPEGRPERGRPVPPWQRREGSAAAAARIQQQQSWVDLQIRQAIERGEFENLSGAGKPIDDLGDEHDPDWWLKRLIERERLVVLPPSLQMRKEDAELDGQLDKLAAEKLVREAVEAFNSRVRSARLHTEGPPFITQLRDVDREVERWRERRAERLAAAEQQVADAAQPKRRWWQRRRR
ncbi:DUF1992 domain-containing protein [Nocardioides sp. Kera G14]|uniref:DnaJ family domain-containing protein n=1 Tax=Nocardioides sp. Kera G14 TaxID=2884264 RepID=UPI001D12E137|nr:DUF1992 domain-containing protein [Nocardioides sp. Kera G14]UDY23213.1 DUF1992 domain-containing protein [Nocardioides sp. Kera G14]